MLAKSIETAIKDQNLGQSFCSAGTFPVVVDIELISEPPGAIWSAMLTLCTVEYNGMRIAIHKDMLNKLLDVVVIVEILSWHIRRAADVTALVVVVLSAIDNNNFVASTRFQ